MGRSHLDAFERQVDQPLLHAPFLPVRLDVGDRQRGLDAGHHPSDSLGIAAQQLLERFGGAVVPSPNEAKEPLFLTTTELVPCRCRAFAVSPRELLEARRVRNTANAVGVKEEQIAPAPRADKRSVLTVAARLPPDLDVADEWQCSKAKRADLLGGQPACF